jgi:hypothetical protein
MFLVYTVLGGVWGWLCYKHKEDILPIQVGVTTFENVDTAHLHLDSTTSPG